ncbi:hypothetical protein L9F63_024365, partial [Diploptera punctata]
FLELMIITLCVLNIIRRRVFLVTGYFPPCTELAETGSCLSEEIAAAFTLMS